MRHTATVLGSTNKKLTASTMAFDGYVYELQEDATFDWLTAPPEAWEITVVSKSEDSKRAAQELGAVLIDDTMCMVFLCNDRRVRAITMVAARAGKVS